MRPRIVALVAGGAFALAATLTAFTMLVGSWAPQDGVRTTGVAAVGGPFTLTDETGRQVTEAELLGRPSVIFFGFTYCPDVCPTTLYEMSNLMERLGPKADRMNWVFVSVDWERDGPEEMRAYLQAFDERIRGFTGTKEQIDAITSAYKVFYERVPTGEGEGDYTINHTASVFLMDGKGGFVGTLGYGEDADTMLAKLERLAAGG